MKAALAATLLACALCARAAPPDVVVETELEPARVYVGAEARLTLRLLRAPGVAHGALQVPDLGDAAEVSPLRPSRRYEIRRDGVSYQVIERAYALVPRRSGRLVLAGAALDTVVRYGDPQNDGTELEPGSPRGPLRVLDVRPVPPAAGKPWLPARSLTLEEAWSRDPAALAAGLPVTRTLIVRAEGLAAERLPLLEMAAHPALRAHHDLPELSTEYPPAGIAGRSVRRIVLIPLADGEAALPEVSVRWWDVAADVPRIAALPARTLRLQAALPPAQAPLAEPPGALARSLLLWGSGLLLFVIAVALWAYERTEALRASRGRLRMACVRNDARAARDALLEWRRTAAPKEPVPLALRLGDDWDTRARSQLRALDAALYAGRAWDGLEFWRAVRPWLRRKPARRAAPALPPLFRLQER